MDAQFSGFLDDVLDDFSFRDGLEQRDLIGQGRRMIFLDDFEFDAVAMWGDSFAKELVSRAVEHDHALGFLQAQYVERVMRLAVAQMQHRILALGWREIE